MIKVFDPLEYKKIKIDSKSTSFCGAKYYLATMWLQAGMTASCHHNPSHAIDINEIALNPSALHNTKQKKQEREDMRQGLKPSGCHYCWNIESIGDLAVSDRIWNSHANSDEELDQAFAADYNENFNLTRLEISFDRTCQFACSYCSPWVSSSWHKDIKINGTYKNLEVETRRQYTSPVDNDMPYAPNESNPYIDAFFKWWESDLHKTLKELRITGGEPFMSGHFWRLIGWLQHHKDQTTATFAINTNLGYNINELEKLFNKINGNNVAFYVSIESVGGKSEYARDGLDWNVFHNNLEYLFKQNCKVYIMSTVSAITLDGMVDFLEYSMNYKLKYGISILQYTIAIVDHPNFQSPLVLPYYIRKQYADEIQQWVNKYKHNYPMILQEESHIERLIQFLKTPDSEEINGVPIKDLRSGFKSFFTQYDQRRGKSFTDTFPRLAEWYNTL